MYRDGWYTGLEEQGHFRTIVWYRGMFCAPAGEQVFTWCGMVDGGLGLSVAMSTMGHGPGS
jgi:hypothetical protein